MRISTLLSRALTVAMLSLAACLPAQASLIDFEDALPTLFAGGAIASGGSKFASTGSGFSGVDSAGAFVYGNAPSNSDGQFLFALNGDGLTMTDSGGGAFRLWSFDASFIAPLGGLTPNASAGQLHLNGISAGGQALSEFFDLGLSDANGNFGFSSFYANALGSGGLLSVTFTACVYQSGGSCSFTDPFLQPQFALDNIKVPEPGSTALLMAAFGALALVRRRQSI